MGDSQPDVPHAAYNYTLTYTLYFTLNHHHPPVMDRYKDN